LPARGRLIPANSYVDDMPGPWYCWLVWLKRGWGAALDGEASLG